MVPAAAADGGGGRGLRRRHVSDKNKKMKQPVWGFTEPNKLTKTKIGPAGAGGGGRGLCRHHVSEKN